MGGGILINDTLDLRMAGMNFVAILAFTLVWEHFTELLEEALEGQDHFLQMLSKIYRELMILGFISLMLVLSLEFSAPWVQDHRHLIHFEFAHLLIFFWAVVYTLSALVATYRLKKTRASWTRVTNTDTVDLCFGVEQNLMSKSDTISEGIGEFGQRLGPAGLVHDAVAKPVRLIKDLVGLKLRPDRLALALAAGQGSKWTGSWLSLLPFADPTFEDVEWKIMQRLFLRNFKLPHEFDYSKYLMHKLNDSLAAALDVKPKTWGVVIAITLLVELVSLLWGDWSDKRCPDITAGGHRRLGGGAAGGAGGVELTPEVAQQEIIAMLIMGWVLVAANSYMCFFIKRGIIKLLRHQGCENPANMPLFLRMLDAQRKCACRGVRTFLLVVAAVVGGGTKFWFDASGCCCCCFFSGGAAPNVKNYSFSRRGRRILRTSIK